MVLFQNFFIQLVGDYVLGKMVSLKGIFDSLKFAVGLVFGFLTLRMLWAVIKCTSFITNRSVTD